MEHNYDKTVRYLEDLHAAEKAFEQVLAGHAEDEKVPSAVRSICVRAVQGTRSRTAMIEQRLNDLGANTSGVKDLMNSAATAISNLWNVGHESVDKITQDLIKAHAGAHLVHASYVALGSYSSQMSDSGTLALAEQGKGEASAIANELLPAIDQIARVAPNAA